MGLMSMPNDLKPSLQHIAIIMDGNRRWARLHHQPAIFGHRKGAETLRDIANECIILQIPFLTVYAFSTENWQRPPVEVEGQLSLLRLYLRQEIESLNEKGIRLRVIGDRYGFAPDIVTLIENAEESTRNNKALTLSIALNYGARSEMMRAVQAMLMAVEEGRLSKANLTPETFSSFLDTSYAPDPDMIIRTSGEQRLSNFLLWQAEYSELFFSETLWPAFTTQEFRYIIETYSKRDRRFGGNGAKVASKEPRAVE